jgi:predicted TIM-barrel fold metal-dependent hydrolase
MDDDNVSKAVLVPIKEADNKECLKVSSRYPERFSLVAYLDPRFFKSQKAVERTLFEYKNAGFKAVKIHPRLGSFHLNDKKVSWIVAEAGKIQMPVMICTIIKYPAPVLKRPLWDSIDELCRKHRNTTIILVHGGYFDILAVSEIIRPYENIFIDISTTLPRFLKSSIAADLAFVISTLNKRVVVGSDYPEYRMKTVVEALLSLNIDEKKLHDICYANASQIFSP